MNNISKTNKLLATMIILAITVTACTTFVRTSYQTLSSVATIVDTARNGYNEFYKAGMVKPELAAKVEQAYPIYQQSMGLAVQAVKAYQNLAATGVIVPPDSANLAIQNAQDKTNELLAVFAEAGGPKVEPVTIEKIVVKGK